MAKRVATAEFKRNRAAMLKEHPYCAVCGKPGGHLDKRLKLECDHIIPVQDGGSDKRENLQLLCRKDHRKKTAAQVNRPGNEKAQVMRALHSRSGMRWWMYARNKKKKEEDGDTGEQEENQTEDT